MNMDPNGNKPEAGIIKDGLEYQGEKGMGLGILLTRHGLSDLPIQWRPNIVPTIDNGSETNAHITIIFTMTEKGMTPKVL